MLNAYLKKLFEISKTGDATEESYYSALVDLLNDYTNKKRKPKIHITTLPKKTEAGNPDFRVWDGTQHIIGYIEAKSPLIENLGLKEKTDQLKRYLNTFPNLILTNFFEFRLYRNGILIDKTIIARPFIIYKLKAIPPVEKESDFFLLLEKFFSFSFPKLYTAKTLAIELAKRTKFLKEEVVSEELKETEAGGKGFILGFYNAFRNYLIKGLTKEEFADFYSQTITYGLFAARTRSKDKFNRKLAYDKIPQTIGILRNVFEFISLGKLPVQMEWIIDDISEVLAATDVKKILHQYFHEGKGKDPIVHFYETFLTEYDPKTREKRGVYYTPESIVTYIVRSLHSILKQQFNKVDGFASDNVTVLDPAAGTLTFLAEAAKLAVDEFKNKYGDGGIKNFIKEHILRNFYAFELMMAPYAIGHLKMSFLIEELGHKLKEDDRFKLYLTNSLEMEELAQTELPGMASLSEESRHANEIKKKTPILVILGNPPYSVSSTNKSKFIEKEMNVYKEDVRMERNLQPLSDDYIKFIRFAEWKINRTGYGVIGIITNNSYLTGLIHRSMRKYLLQNFNKIFILNLHGSSIFKEKTPEGNKDENVFDIRQGVAITILIKNKSHQGQAKIYVEDIFGLRSNKYEYLSKNNVDTTKWKLIKPKKPFYFFAEKDFSSNKNYENFISITDIFKEYSSGVKTHRDQFVIGYTKEEIKQKMQIFTSNLPNDVIMKSLNLKETKNFKISKAKKKIKDLNWDNSIIEYSYRPFDNRYICYHPDLIDRDRYSIMQNFFNENLGLMIMRQYLYEPVKIYNYVLCVNNITDTRIFISNRGAGFIFPLYLYPDINKKDLFTRTKIIKNRQTNLNDRFLYTLNNIYKNEISEKEIFYYIYAILHSTIFRKTYTELLKIDFPRIPFANDFFALDQIAKFGKELVELHLFRSQKYKKSFGKFQGHGNNQIEKVSYNSKKHCVFFNEKQYFEGLTKNIWEYQIGGYQVCEKWLKDRKGRTLSLGEIKHYCKIITSIKNTIKIQKEIDQIYPKIEKELINFNL